MGGIDLDNATAMVIEGLSLVDWQNQPKIEVIMGKNALHIKEVEALVNELQLDITVLTDVNGMAERMLDAGLAIGAGGITTRERCCLGLPSLVINLAANQALIVQNVDSAGASVHIGNKKSITVSDVKEPVQKLVDDDAIMKSMVDIGFQLVDGLKPSRLLEHIDIIK